jgi:hypothetical protein
MLFAQIIILTLENTGRTSTLDMLELLFLYMALKNIYRTLQLDTLYLFLKLLV